MPDIDSIPEVLYKPSQPYHYIYDNIPLRNILSRIRLVNYQVDTNTDLLRGASGTVGSLNARLDAALAADGKLKASAINDANHSIAHHEDGSKDGVDYVRMTGAERDKLSGMQPGACKLEIELDGVSFPPPGSNGKLVLQNSTSIFFELIAPNSVLAHSTFPPDVAHRHHYEVIPAYDNAQRPSFITFMTSSLNTPYMTGSLRVYVNGMRLSTGRAIQVPDLSGSSSSSWNALYVVEPSAQDEKQGKFVLSRAISVNDVIRIDFDEIISPTSAFSSSSSSSSRFNTNGGINISSSTSASIITSGSSSSTCDVIECGGTMASADCGLIYEPGYTYFMDCSICKCVKTPVSSSSSSS
jgi:hypothetical protein